MTNTGSVQSKKCGEDCRSCDGLKGSILVCEERRDLD